MPANGLSTNKDPSLLQRQQQATARALELNLMEFITALLCWCERVEAHPDYPGSEQARPSSERQWGGSLRPVQKS